MEKEIYGINEAMILLKEGNKLKDSSSRLFVFKRNRIYIYSSQASYSLKIEEFATLYKEGKFIIYSDDDEGIDSKKDEEYYSYKHK